MKDEDLKLEEIEVSHTLGGDVKHTQIRQSHGLKETMPVWVVITDAPVCMRERFFFYYERIKRELNRKHIKVLVGVMKD